MNILYIAAFTTNRFRTANGDHNTPALGGLRKIELILMALAKRHRVVVLSSAMLSNSRPVWRPHTDEWITPGQGQPVKIIYPSALMLRPLGGAINSLRAPGLLRRVLDEFRPDAAMVYNSYLFEYRAASELARTADIPILLEIEDLPLARRREWVNIKPRIDQLCWDRMLSIATAFTAVNQPIYQSLPDGKPKALLPGLVDQQLIQLSRERTAPFGGRKKILGYFGALTPEKGVGVLLQLLPRLDPSWSLLVTGSGPLASAFADLQGQYPERVTFAGTVAPEQMYKMMCSCDCTVIPRELITGGGQGVFPFKTLEYIVAGTHVIAAPLSGQLDLDLSYIQRWDGSLGGLERSLVRSEEDYAREQPQRMAATAAIIDRYDLEGTARLIERLMAGGVTAAPGIPH